MGCRILRKLKLVNFRNYRTFNINFQKNINIIIGDNAQGKTNILESIYTLALTKSYRTANDSNLVRLDQEKFIISGETKDNKIFKKLSLEFLDSFILLFSNSILVFSSLFRLNKFLKNFFILDILN